MTDLLSEETFQAALDSEFSRLTFVKGGGAMVVGFSVAGAACSLARRQGAPARVRPARPTRRRSTRGLRFTRTTQPRSTSARSTSPGTNTGLLQIAAEELDMTMAQVKEAVVDTEYSPNQGVTAGSNGISAGGPQVRQASAEARAVAARARRDASSASRPRSSRSRRASSR